MNTMCHLDLQSKTNALKIEMYTSKSLNIKLSVINIDNWSFPELDIVQFGMVLIYALVYLSESILKFNNREI